MVLNNYTESDILYINDFFPQIFKLFVANKEVAGTGTPHLQGYSEMKHPSTIKSLQKRLKMLGQGRWHIEVANGTRKQNLQYIKKTKSTLDICIGDPNDKAFEQKERIHNKNKLEPVIDMIKAGSNIHDIAVQNPAMYVRSSTGIEKLYHHFSQPRNFQTIGYWLYGETGQGKSRWANQHFPEAYYKDPETDWWDGYYGQETVIIDDYRPSKSLSFAKILRLVDRYPLQVQVKCAFAQFVSKRIIFTSPMSLLDTFSRCEWLKSEELDQLQRRIPHQLHFFPGSIVTSMSPANYEQPPTLTVNPETPN